MAKIGQIFDFEMQSDDPLTSRTTSTLFGESQFLANFNKNVRLTPYIFFNFGQKMKCPQICWRDAPLTLEHIRIMCRVILALYREISAQIFGKINENCDNFPAKTSLFWAKIGQIFDFGMQSDDPLTSRTTSTLFGEKSIFGQF